MGITSSITGLASKTVDYINLASKIIGAEQGIYGSLEEHSSSNIVLSFRPVQAERIVALQRKLLALLNRRQQLQAVTPTDASLRGFLESSELERINERIDAYLHTYGSYQWQIGAYRVLTYEYSQCVARLRNVLSRSSIGLFPYTQPDQAFLLSRV